MMLSPDMTPIIISLIKTDSTNNYLKALSCEKELKEFTVVTSQFQTSGKGQRGNSWESENSRNLLFSILLYPSFLPVISQFMLSEIISISIKEEFDLYSEGFSIKWPNDIYWKEKKIGGILIENDLDTTGLQKSIIGVGLNINQTFFTTPGLNAVSLKQITNEEQNCDKILRNILDRFTEYYRQLKDQQYTNIVKSYHHSLYRKEGYHPYQDKNSTFYGKIIKVENNGTLLLEDDKKEVRKYLFKEICFK